MIHSKGLRRLAIGVAASLLAASGAYAIGKGQLMGAPKELNPCAAKTLNPCAAKKLNPCAAKGLNPCGGGSVNPCRFKRPSSVRLASGSPSDLVRAGQKLWNDRSLGKSGLACSSCHIDNYMQMNPTFGTPYPHEVAMPKQHAGVGEVSADEMVQFCMIVPMADDPLPWNSTELAALTAYVQSIQPGYKPLGGAMNPCNPCGTRNPRDLKNPCNPCAMKR